MLVAKKLKKLRKNKKAGNGILYVGLVCDGVLFDSASFNPLKIKGKRAVKKFQKYLSQVSRKLKKN